MHKSLELRVSAAKNEARIPIPPHTINGELNKLARNLSFGHSILSAIHWHNDSDSSMVLGETVSISILQD